MFILWYDTIVAPSKRKNKQNNINGKKTSTESKCYKKFVKNDTNKSKSSNKTIFKKKTPTCYKCGKVGYYSKDCQLENKINSLKISDKLKTLMIRLMINKEEEEDSIEYYESKEENHILIT